MFFQESHKPIMKQIWTPWRRRYVKSVTKRVITGCVFCQKIDMPDHEEHVIARSTHVYVTLNRYPYSNGHLMVVPYAHVATQEQLDEAALLDLMLMVNRSLAVLRRAYNPQAFNLGANIGEAAGAGVAAHYHFHIVPRWEGDANFMTSVGDTRIIPNSLDDCFNDLKGIWDSITAEADNSGSSHAEV